MIKSCRLVPGVTGVLLGVSDGLGVAAAIGGGAVGAGAGATPGIGAGGLVKSAPSVNFEAGGVGGIAGLGGAPDTN